MFVIRNFLSKCEQMHSFLEKPISCSVTRLMTCFVKGKVFFRIQRFSLLEVNFCGSVHFLEILRKLGTWNRNFRYIWFMEAKMMHDILWPLSRLSHFYIPVFQSFCGVFLLPFAINFFCSFHPPVFLFIFIFILFLLKTEVKYELLQKPTSRDTYTVLRKI